MDEASPDRAGDHQEVTGFARHKDEQDIPDAELRRALTNAGYTVKTIRRTQTPIAELRARLKQSKP